MGATLIFITGKSGSGKDTIQKELIAYDKNNSISGCNPKRLHKMKLYTTREKREGETYDDYAFLTEEEFTAFTRDGVIDEHRIYNMINEECIQYPVYYGSSGVKFDKNRIYIGNGAIDQLRNYINLHLEGVPRNITLCDFSYFGNIYDLSKLKIKNDSHIVVIYPYVSEDKRIARLMDRSINNDNDIDYYEFYRRQFQDYERFGEIYRILDNTAKHVLASNDNYIHYISFNEYSKITYCFVNNLLDYDTLHNKIIPNLYKDIVLSKVHESKYPNLRSSEAKDKIERINDPYSNRFVPGC